MLDKKTSKCKILLIIVKKIIKNALQRQQTGT